MEGVTLGNISGGALGELFQAELDRVLSNIADPNTDTGTKRTITMTVKFKPNRDREVADVEIACGSKLAGIMSVNTQLFIGKYKGKLVAVESDPRQSKLFDQVDRPLAAVSNIQEGRD